MLTKEQVFEAAKQGLSEVDAKDDKEAEHFAAMYMRVRALEPATPDVPAGVPRFGGTFEVPLPADLEARMRVAFKAALEAPALPPPET